MKIFEIKENDAGRRLDKFLTSSLPLLPKSMMYKYIRTKKIKVNRKRAEIGQILSVGDTVELFIKEEFLEAKPKDDFFKKINPVFGVIYEDENILLCDKPSGLLCHSDESGTEHTYRTGEIVSFPKRGIYSRKRSLFCARALQQNRQKHRGYRHRREKREDAARHER